MSIRNRPTKHDIRIKVGPFATQKLAFAELRKHGYVRRPEMNDLPIKFEKSLYPAFTVASDDNRITFTIVEYPSDAEIFKVLPTRIENPDKLKDRDDK